MSITSDIRSYADSALEQGKQVLDQAQAQFNEVTGSVTTTANEFVGKVTNTAKSNYSELSAKATDAVTDLRTQAEKALNLEAIKSAVEPYLAQAKDYGSSVTDRATVLLDSVKGDKRVASLISSVESASGTVVETVTERVIKPVQSLTGLGAKASTPTKAAPVKVTAVKATPVAAKKAPAKKVAAKKAPAKKAAK